VYRKANETYGALAQSSRVKNNLIRKLKKYPALTYASMGLFGMSPKAAIGVPVGLAGLKAAEITSRVMKSPVLRNHYISLMKNALRDESAAMMSDMDKLNKGIYKLEKEAPSKR